MKRKKWAVKSVLAILGLILTILAIGFVLPEKHIASVDGELDLSSEKVWELISEYEKFPEWRSNVSSVQPLSSTAWVEVNAQNEQVKYKQTEKIDQQRLVTEIASKGLPYSGKWIFTIEPKGGKTVLTIEEQGEVYNPIFRFVSKFIIGHKSSINQYFADLQKL